MTRLLFFFFAGFSAIWVCIFLLLSHSFWISESFQMQTNLRFEVVQFTGSFSRDAKALRQSHVKLHSTAASESTISKVIELNNLGNTHLKNGEIGSAIHCYNLALSIEDESQHAVLLVMRGTALLQRAFDCKMRVQEIGKYLAQLLPTAAAVTWYWEATRALPMPMRMRAISFQLRKSRRSFLQLDSAPGWNAVKGAWQEAKEGDLPLNGQELMQRAVFLRCLYETALHSSLEDSLTGMLVQPDFAQAWRRAADALAEMALYVRAEEFYTVAMRLDPSMAELLRPTIERIRLQARVPGRNELLR